MDFLTNCSVFKGISTIGDNLYVAIMNDGLADERCQHSIPMFFNGVSWSLLSEEKVLPWLVAGINSSDNLQETVIVGWAGQTLIITNDNFIRAAIRRKDAGYNISVVRSVAEVDGFLYAVGMNREVYKKTKDGWMEIDDGTVCGGDGSEGFNAIDGFSGSEIYAVGLKGEIWCYDSHKWHQVETPTTVDMHSICCASDGYVYISGSKGVLIRGRGESWGIIETGINETIWNSCFFKGILYFATKEHVYSYRNDKIKRITSNMFDNQEIQNFSTSQNNLFVFCQKTIVKFDGLSWQEVLCSINDDAIQNEAHSFFQENAVDLVDPDDIG